MLKSPSSILNSIQRMKTNLRNDKEQLRIIKTNFVYLDHIQPRSRPIDHETKVKNRSKSVLNSNQIIQVSSQESPHDKQNDNTKANIIQKDNDSRITIKDQISTQHDSTVKTNRIYLSTQHSPTQPQNILHIQSTNFKKHQSSRVSSYHEDKPAKQSSQLKTMKARYQKEIEKMRQEHEEEKRELLERVMGQAKEEREEWERQRREMREYIELLEGQVRDMAEGKNSRRDLVNTSCQMTLEKIVTPEQKSEKVQQSTQTTQQQSVNRISSISSSHNNNNHNHFTSNEQSHNPIGSSIDKENSPNPSINGICVHQNNLIEELCMKYFGGNTDRNHNDHVLEKQVYSSGNHSQQSPFHPNERQKYQHIINKLLEQNTKLYNKLQRVSGQAHSSQNPQNPSNKAPFFKSFGINYKTVTSHGGEQQHSSVTQRSRVINKYPLSKESQSIPGHSRVESQFPSRVTEPHNYHTHREGSVDNNKGKQSIVYRISNVMSAQLAKEGKSQSRSKIPMKNPPVKGKPGINVLVPEKQRRMKTQVSDKESQFYSDNFNSNKMISVFDTLGGESREISSEQRIPTMREKLKNQPSFKFYDDDSQVSQFVTKNNNKPSNANNIPSWQDQSEGEIKDDQIKLKTIKNFRCLQNQ